MTKLKPLVVSYKNDQELVSSKLEPTIDVPEENIVNTEFKMVDGQMQQVCVNDQNPMSGSYKRVN